MRAGVAWCDMSEGFGFSLRSRIPPGERFHGFQKWLPWAPRYTLDLVSSLLQAFDK